MKQDIMLTPQEAEEMGVILNKEILNDDDFLDEDELTEKYGD